jgi:hypothetical protein
MSLIISMPTSNLSMPCQMNNPPITTRRTSGATGTGAVQSRADLMHGMNLRTLTGPSGDGRGRNPPTSTSDSSVLRSAARDAVDAVRAPPPARDHEAQADRERHQGALAAAEHGEDRDDDDACDDLDGHTEVGAREHQVAHVLSPRAPSCRAGTPTTRTRTCPRAPPPRVELRRAGRRLRCRAGSRSSRAGRRRTRRRSRRR